MIQTTRQQFLARVTDNLPICREHFRLTLRLDWFPPTDPGQFLQVACRSNDFSEVVDPEYDWDPSRPPTLHGDELQGPLAMLRRPFSLAGRRDGDAFAELDLIQRVVGMGTSWLSNLQIGSEVSIIGPLGNRFRLPNEGETAILVGGGVGIPPMLYLASRLAGKKAVAFCGALTRDLLPLTVTADAPEPDAQRIDPLYNIDEFARHGVPAVITTDDGSYGYRGFVTQALESYLDRYFFSPGRQSHIKPVIYTCGPEGMMKRVAEIAMTRGVECQVAVERAMACGMGTCQSCCIKVAKPDPAVAPMPGQDWCWRLACTDGPVFLASQLRW